jgi:hypothetical protein
LLHERKVHLNPGQFPPPPPGSISGALVLEAVSTPGT